MTIVQENTIGLSDDVEPVATPRSRLETVLRFAASRAISDVHVKAGQRPLYRRFGQLITRRDEPVFSAEDLADIVAGLMPDALHADFEQTGHATWLFGLVGGGRFRVTALRANSVPTLAIRVLQPRVMNLRELNLPRSLAGWPLLPHGLILVAGTPGSGRTTTWQAMLEQANTAAQMAQQIVTLEAPIELPLEDKVAFVHQREIGSDVPDIATGIADAMRQSADIVGFGELAMQDLPEAMLVADLQRLAIAVVAGSGVVDVLRRAIEAVPSDQRAAWRSRLGRRLRGVIHQTLVPTADGKGLVPACEVLTVNQAVADLLRSDRDLDGLYGILESPASRHAGMIGRDASLAELVQAGLITLESAQRAARDPEGVRGRVGGMRPLGTTGPVNPGLTGQFIVPPGLMQTGQTMTVGAPPPTGEIAPPTKKEPIL